MLANYVEISQTSPHNDPTLSRNSLPTRIWPPEHFQTRSPEANFAITNAKIETNSTKKHSKIELEREFMTKSLCKPLFHEIPADFHALQKKSFIQAASLH